MMNRNNPLQQQQCHQCDWNGASQNILTEAQCIITEVQVLLHVIEEDLLVHGKEWEEISQAHGMIVSPAVSELVI